MLGVLVALLLALLLAAFLVFQNLKEGYDRNIERFGDPFAAIDPTTRPSMAPEAEDALNVLLLGSDSRVSAGDPAQWKAGAQRTDAIMIVHVDADRKHPAIISIPRDSWVPIPENGHGKINAAFSFGGPTLMVRTVEKLTGVRIDHVAIVDFTGFVTITDALGGVDITVPKDTHDSRIDLTAGTHHLDGDTALKYVRQRYNLPGGDFDRVKRQQNWLRAVMKKLLSKDLIGHPWDLDSSLTALTKALSTDEGFTIDEMQDLAVSLKNLHADDVSFFTVPTTGTGWSPDGKQSIVKLDTEQGGTLWQAVQKDTLTDWITQNRPELLGRTVR
ncbi:MAG: hypothetical protein QG608_271 [Actinomycetota bacterium]|nr:hypothetical protein [Actinomycetota bacterium]